MKRSQKAKVGALPVQEELFCQEFLKDLNATKAFVRAGFTAANDRVAAANSARLMAKPEVQSRIAELGEARAKRIGIDADKVLAELARIAFSDISGLFDDNNNVLPPRQWKKNLRRAVASIEVDELYEWEDGQRTQVGVTKKVKFWPKTSALEMIGKHLKLFTMKHEHNVGEKTLEQLLEASRQPKEGDKKA